MWRNRLWHVVGCCAMGTVQHGRPILMARTNGLDAGSVHKSIRISGAGYWRTRTAGRKPRCEVNQAAERAAGAAATWHAEVPERELQGHHSRWVVLLHLHLEHLSSAPPEPPTIASACAVPVQDFLPCLQFHSRRLSSVSTMPQPQ